MRFALLLVTLCLTSHAFCQKIRFTDKRNNWYTTGTFPECYFYKHYYYGPDSIVNGKQYTCLYCSADYSLSYPDCHFSSGIAVELIREDSLAGKVYYVSPAYDTVEHILYDYTLNPGDSFTHISPLHVALNRDSISRIDTVTINGISHKAQVLTRRGNAYCEYLIVEGIGGLGGPISPDAWFACIFEYDERLECFQQDTTTPFFVVHGPSVYTDTFSNAAKCGKFLSVPSSQRSAVTPVVLPNPANDKIIVSGIDPDHVAHITATNCWGAKVLSSNITGKEIDVDCSGWPNGIYFILISDERYSVAEKIVIQH